MEVGKRSVPGRTGALQGGVRDPDYVLRDRLGEHLRVVHLRDDLLLGPLAELAERSEDRVAEGGGRGGPLVALGVGGVHEVGDVVHENLDEGVDDALLGRRDGLHPGAHLRGVFGLFQRVD